jgi:hypothetical protein
MNHSQVMITAYELMDGIGPRLTISTNMRKAQGWAVAKLTGYGLSNVHREGFDFGRGWDIIHSSVRLVSPRPMDDRSGGLDAGYEGSLRAPLSSLRWTVPEQFPRYRAN